MTGNWPKIEKGQAIPQGQVCSSMSSSSSYDGSSNPKPHLSKWLGNAQNKEKQIEMDDSLSV